MPSGNPRSPTGSPFAVVCRNVLTIAARATQSTPPAQPGWLHSANTTPKYCYRELGDAVAFSTDNRHSHGSRLPDRRSSISSRGRRRVAGTQCTAGGWHGVWPPRSGSKPSDNSQVSPSPPTFRLLRGSRAAAPAGNESRWCSFSPRACRISSRWTHTHPGQGIHQVHDCEGGSRRFAGVSREVSGEARTIQLSLRRSAPFFRMAVVAQFDGDWPMPRCPWGQPHPALGHSVRGRRRGRCLEPSRWHR
jgi:hypothetical protein